MAFVAVLVLAFCLSLGWLVAHYTDHTLSVGQLLLTMVAGLECWIIAGMGMSEQPRYRQCREGGFRSELLQMLGQLVGVLVTIFLLLLIVLVAMPNQSTADSMMYQRRVTTFNIISLALAALFIGCYFMSVFRLRVKDGVIVVRAGRIIYPGETIRLWPWFQPEIKVVEANQPDIKMSINLEVNTSTDAYYVMATLLVSVWLDIATAKAGQVRSFDLAMFRRSAAGYLLRQICESSMCTSFDQMDIYLNGCHAGRVDGFPFQLERGYTLTTETTLAPQR